ncbi:putative membrane protein [Enterobacter sp. OLF]|nr:putative membrane protein [Enterobacter sp. OLF]
MTFLYVGVREPNKNRSMILLWLDIAMVDFCAIVNLVCIVRHRA